MKAIILAAGLGSRLRPHTSDRPKCLVEIDGVSILDRQIKVLHSRDINEIVIVGGYRADLLRDKGTRLRLNPRYEETNMVWSLFCAEDEMDSELIVSYGDIVYSGEILDRLLSSSADIAVAVDMEWESYWQSRSADPLADAETLRLGENGAILEIGQRPESLAEVEGQYMGVMKFTARGVAQLKTVFHDVVSAGMLGGKSAEASHMTDLLHALILRDYSVTGVKSREPWVEIDTVEDFFSDISRTRLREIFDML